MSGQPVALVVAESIAQAQDAAELVAVDYEELRRGRRRARGACAGAPQLWPEAPGNVAIDWPGPVPDDGSNAREIEQIFSGAAHVARVSAVNQRLVVASMEPRGATARYDAATDRYTLRSCSQGAGPQRDQIIAMMGWPTREAARHHRGCRRRVRAEDRGLSGISGAARRREAHRPAGRLDGDALGVVPLRPAGARHRHRRRACDRREGQVPRAARQTHRQHGRVRRRARRAHPDEQLSRAAFPACTRSRVSQVGVQCVFTNTVPTGPYRGAGRPEANYALERLVEEAARVTGIDPVRLRRRNLIPAQGDAVQDGGRHDVRLRRLRADPRKGAGAVALRGIQEAPPRVVQAQEAARHRHFVLPRTCGRRCRPRARRCCFPAATGSCSASACRTPDRDTPRSIRG